MDSNAPKIIVPGTAQIYLCCRENYLTRFIEIPASWTPPVLPVQLTSDQGECLRDENGVRFQDHYMLPAVKSIFVINESFDRSAIDIMGCASSIANLLRFAPSVEATFRFVVEVIGNTLFLIQMRRCRASEDTDIPSSTRSLLTRTKYVRPSHINVSSNIKLRGLNCFVHLSVMAMTPPQARARITSQSTKQTCQSSLHRAAQWTLPIGFAGVLVAQESIIDVNTGARNRGDIDLSAHLP